MTFRSLTSVSLLFVTASLIACGCGSGKSTDKSSEPAETSPAEPTPARSKPKDEITRLCDELRIEKKNGLFTKDMDGKIVEANLDKCGVKNIEPLKGLPLKTLRLNYNSTYDLAPIADMPIEFLNLQATPVYDISPVKKLPLNTLWLNDTKVTDLSPLNGKSLVSLDLTNTQVSDLSALRGMTTLKRLNLSRCSKLTDLTPLEGLQLERLTFNPETITKGLDAVRKMTSLRALHVKFPHGRAYRRFEFWQSFDAGTLPRDSVAR